VRRLKSYLIGIIIFFFGCLSSCLSSRIWEERNGRIPPFLFSSVMSRRAFVPPPLPFSELEHRSYQRAGTIAVGPPCFVKIENDVRLFPSSLEQAAGFCFFSLFQDKLLKTASPLFFLFRAVAERRDASPGRALFSFFSSDG